MEDDNANVNFPFRDWIRPGFGVAAQDPFGFDHGYAFSKVTQFYGGVRSGGATANDEHIAADYVGWAVVPLVEGFWAIWECYSRCCKQAHGKEVTSAFPREEQHHYLFWLAKNFRILNMIKQYQMVVIPEHYVFRTDGNSYLQDGYNYFCPLGGKCFHTRIAAHLRLSCGISAVANGVRLVSIMFEHW